VKQKRPEHVVAINPKAFRDKVQKAKETTLEDVKRRGRRLPSSVCKGPSIEIGDTKPADEPELQSAEFGARKSSGASLDYLSVPNTKKYRRI
jgi:hypothetical protein